MVLLYRYSYLLVDLANVRSDSCLQLIARSSLAKSSSELAATLELRRRTRLLSVVMLARSLSKQLLRRPAGAAFRAPLRQFHATPPALVAVGDKIPSVELDHGFQDMVKVNLAERCAGRKVILLGLPGAFTPC